LDILEDYNYNIDSGDKHEKALNYAFETWEELIRESVINEYITKEELEEN